MRAEVVSNTVQEHKLKNRKIEKDISDYPFS